MQAGMVLHVQMLGAFCLSDGKGRTLSADEIRSPMLIKLMAYIFSHHTENISSQELIEALWPNESSGNPIGALRNLIHRLRLLMKNVWGEEAEDFLLTGGGFYCWNEKIGLDIDAEHFDTLCRDAELMQSDAERIACYEKALSLYRGEFMKGFDESYWMTSMAVLMHSRYLGATKDYLALLEKTGQYEKMEKIAGSALWKELLDEELHVYLIRSLMGQGKQRLALEQYMNSSRILCENLGTTHLEGMQRIYESLMQQNKEVQPDIAVIRQELDLDCEKKPILCDYGMFRKIYQIRQGAMKRLEVPVHLILVSVTIEYAEEVDANGEEKQFGSVMELFEKTLLQSIYPGDVAARYSRSQYVLLLSKWNFETVEKMRRRVERSCRKNIQKAMGDAIKIHIQYSVDKIV